MSKRQGMVAYCILCGSRREKCISYHRFPQDATLREKWLEFCGMKEVHLKSISSVCSRHFIMNDFVKHLNRSTLKPSSIPSIYNADSSDEIEDTIITEECPCSTKTQMPLDKNNIEECTTDAENDSIVQDNDQPSISVDEGQDIGIVNKSDFHEIIPSKKDSHIPLDNNVKIEYIIDIENQTFVENENATESLSSAEENQDDEMENTLDIHKHIPRKKSSNILLFKSGKHEYTIDVDHAPFVEENDAEKSAEESQDVDMVTSPDITLIQSGQEEDIIDIEDDSFVEDNDVAEGESAVLDNDINSCRYGVPRYIGDIQLHHLATPSRAEYTLTIVRKTFEKQRRKIKTLQHGNRLLRNRISSMKGLVKHLKRKKLVSQKDVQNYRDTCGKQIEEHTDEEDILEK